MFSMFYLLNFRFLVIIAEYNISLVLSLEYPLLNAPEFLSSYCEQSLFHGIHTQFFLLPQWCFLSFLLKTCYILFNILTTFYTQESVKFFYPLFFNNYCKIISYSRKYFNFKDKKFFVLQCFIFHIVIIQNITYNI